MPLTIDVTEKEPGVFTISPVGSIDAITYEKLEKEIDSILDTSTKTIIFDMQGVSFICSMALKIILETKETIEKNKGRVIITNLQPQIKKVFEIVKSIPDMNIFTSMKEADAYLAAMQRKEMEKNKGF